MINKARVMSNGSIAANAHTNACYAGDCQSFLSELGAKGRLRQLRSASTSMWPALRNWVQVPINSAEF